MSAGLPQPPRDWLVMLRDETRQTSGKAPEGLGGTIVEPGHHLLAGSEFLLREPGGIALHYRQGEGVIVDAPEGADQGEIELWLNGTLFAAIASINGLLPMHASAVAHRGKVYAFTGPSGAGKSTLAAALARRGFALFCDDTLLLDPDSAGSICLPGHKRLKLWPEGLALAGAEGRERVSPNYPKFYASASATDADRPLPLAALAWFEDGEDFALEPVTGAERFARLIDDHYTALLYERASAMERKARFAFQVQLARKLPAWRLTRPFDPARFQSMVVAVARWIEEQAKK